MASTQRVSGTCFGFRGFVVKELGSIPEGLGVSMRTMSPPDRRWTRNRNPKARSRHVRLGT